MIRTVLFDLWGTLIYLPRGWMTFNIFKDHISGDSAFWRRTVKPIMLCQDVSSEEAFVQSISPWLRNPEQADELVSRMRNQLLQDRSEVVEYSDAVGCLDALRRMGFRIAIVSNQASLFESLFNQSKVASRVDVVYFSNRLGVRKPDPLFYDTVLRSLACSADDVLFVGDHYENDFAVPRSLGIPSLWLNRSEQGREEQGSIDTLSALPSLLATAGDAWPKSATLELAGDTPEMNQSHPALSRRY